MTAYTFIKERVIPRLKKGNILDWLVWVATAIQILMIVVNALWTTDTVNYIMFVMNYVVGFTAIASLVYKGIATHFLPTAFFGCFMLFLMAQKPFKPAYDEFLTFTLTKLNTEQYFLFATILFIGLAVTYHAYLYFFEKKNESAQSAVERPALFDRRMLERIVTLVVVLSSPFALYMQGKIVYIKSQMDYTAGYLTNVDVSAVIKIGSFIFSAAILMFLALKPEKKRMFVAWGVYLVIEGGLQLLQGRRALFAATLLFSIWYLLKYFNVKKIGRKLLCLILIIAVMAVLLFALVEQVRSGGQIGLSFKTIRQFLTSTGGSDSVIANTIAQKDEFPKGGFVYLFDPFINNFAGNLLKGQSSLPQGWEYLLQHNSFSHWISYVTEPLLYFSGHGMGSSYLAEVYLAFGLLGVLAVSVFMGWALCKINGATPGAGLFGTSLAFFFVRRLFTLPRSGLFGWVGDSLYLLFTFALVGGIYVLWARKKQSKVEESNVQAVQKKEKTSCRTATIGVIAYNEHLYLPDLLENLQAQTYPKSLTKIVLVDSCSTDDTKQIMQAFCEAHAREYLSVKVLDNPKKNQPSGWNVVISNATADVLMRIDAHAKLPADFVEKNMACINSGEWVCGGPRENIIDEDTPWKNMLLDAEQSLFGSGLAAYRRETEEKKYVSSLFHGAYRREVFDHVGLFNEELIRTEDNEIHYRLRQNGYRICYDPMIKSYYQTRNSLRRMLRQKYENGLWIGKTLFVCPGCISFFHLVPFAFVVMLALSLGLCCFGVWWVLVAMMLAYLAFLLFNTVTCYVKTKNKEDLKLPAVYFLMHFVYGAGTVVGILKRNEK